jgi:hypothetical protein
MTTNKRTTRSAAKLIRRLDAEKLKQVTGGYGTGPDFDNIHSVKP